ncbi:MAG TPA: molybdopterin-dependent oxidoreductase, partial [Anaeromyxobacteraceae bacterium]|nr:molybdopterin-dependent oxidoreductase [Anaeromyxobacteraceae bacterium]
CNVFLDYMGETAYRFRPRENEAVNQEWMCDQGRLGYKLLNQGRVLSAREGRGDAGRSSGREAALAGAARALSEHARAGTLAVLLSPAASLEDLLAAAMVAREGLGVSEAFLGGRKDGWQDDFLKRADENPNRKGAELAAAAHGLALRPFADLAAAVAAGRVKAVWAVGTEVPDAAAAARFGSLEVLVAQAFQADVLAFAATVVLPASPHAEADGTFVSFEGRLQRFEMAWFPRGESRPHWALAGAIGRALGLASGWKTAREVWEALSPRLPPEARAFRWDSLPSLGRRRSLVPLAAGTVDGRLPGYRERTPSETHEDAAPAMARAR